MPRSNSYCESELEEATLEWFEELNYDIIFAPDIASNGEYAEHEDYLDVILQERLEEALARQGTFKAVIK